ncbi:hypothetical protein [uncultured Roseibium sp.]|uniref:hypothetical protein n=1 Tax=uncultured Roseibium sp. TaxID=1936171 RepID=UPI002630D296|nr:hypothetical protein [uncultured Roseibium sp.]
MATTLAGCFRAKDFANAKTFAAALSATFQQYPEAVGRIVVDPVNGLPSTNKFPPSIAEVREALDARQFWGQSLKTTLKRMEKANATVQ